MGSIFSVATLDDVPDLLAYLEAEEAIYDPQDRFVYSKLVFNNTLKFLITQANTTVIIERTEDSKLVGAIGLAIVPHYYSTNFLATKLFWVSATKKSAVKLLRLARKWAKLNGATKFAVSKPAKDLDRLGTMYATETYYVEDL